MACDRISRAAAAVASVILLSMAGGCRTGQSTSIPSPFMADRVPAPASRIPAAGTAQPYYPGDALPPIPASQPAVQPLGGLPPASDITPLAADNIPAATPTGQSGQIPGGDNLVRIPSDELSLRFAARPAPAANPTIISPATPTVAPATAPSVIPVAQNPASPGTANTTPTAFRDHLQSAPTAPIISNWPPVEAPAAQATLNPVVNQQPASGLFRDPAVPAAAPPLIRGAVTQPSTSPRVRMPGGDQMIHEPVVPGSINTTSYQVGMAGGGSMQTMVIPPPGYVPESFAPEQPVAPLPASDGFRARGSSRSRAISGEANPAIPTIRVTPG